MWEAFVAAAHEPPEVTVVNPCRVALRQADLAEIEGAGLRVIVGAPHQVSRAAKYRTPTSRIMDRRSSSNRSSSAPRQVHGSGRSSTNTATIGPKRALKGVDQQIGKAERGIACKGCGETGPVRPAHRRDRWSEPAHTACTGRTDAWTGWR